MNADRPECFGSEGDLRCKDCTHREDCVKAYVERLIQGGEEMEDMIRIDDKEYVQDKSRGCIKHDGEWMAIFVKLKRMQTGMICRGCAAPCVFMGAFHSTSLGCPLGISRYYGEPFYGKVIE